jgi:hypothetical protein
MAHNTRWIVWYSLGLIVIGFAGGYVLREGWLSFVLYHLGGLGAVGLLACASAAIARSKGYGYWRAWLVALLLSVLLGLIAAYLVPTRDQGTRPAACGGSVSLGTGLIAIAVSSFMGRRRNVTGHSDRKE